MDRVFLLAAVAPEHITTEIDKLRSSIFRKTGMVSALALDPVIPIAFYSGPIPKEIFSETKAPEARFKILAAEIAGNSIFLKVNNSHFFQELSAKPEEAEKTSPFFEPFSGFFISECSSPSECNSVMDLIELHKELQSVSWSGLKIQLVEIAYEESSPWFNSLDWNIYWEISLRVLSTST